MGDVTGQEEGKEHPSSRTVRVGVIVTIVASIAGLITTGVATLFGAMVADDQLDQSRQVAEEKRRAQAARVSYWVDIHHDGTNRLHLMNRSPDPISSVQMTFIVFPPSEGSTEVRKILFRAAMPSVPPCSDMVFTPDSMTFSESQPKTDHFWPVLDHPPFGWDSFPKNWLVIIEEVGADFTDRDGVRWRRTHGLLHRNPAARKVTGSFWTGAVQAVPPQPLKSCGD
jgi:hypothetical protein